jgi:hypothetical protein
VKQLTGDYPVVFSAVTVSAVLNHSIEHTLPLIDFQVATVMYRSLILIFLGVWSVTAELPPALQWFGDNVSFWSEGRYDGDYRLFAFRKNQAFRETYFCETNQNVDVAFVAVKKKFYWMFRSEIRGGLGDSPSGMLLHPYDISYGLINTLEYRFKHLHVASGLDHRCFHYVDQRPPEPVVYWNKFIITLNSPHRRDCPAVKQYVSNASWNSINRLMWSFSWGYYIHDFFGLVQPRKIMALSRPHYLHDFQLAGKYGLWHWNSGAVMVTSSTLLGFKTSAKKYWAQETGAELLIAVKDHDIALFVDYVVDGGRFNSKDRLLEYGVRLTK